MKQNLSITVLKKPASLLLLFLMLLAVMPVTACQKSENPLIGLWQLESGTLDVSGGEGRSLFDFKSNGNIDLYSEMPKNDETGSDTDYELKQYRSFKLKYELLSENSFKLSTSLLGEKLEEVMSFSLDGDRLTIVGAESGTMVLIRR